MGKLHDRRAALLAVPVCEFDPFLGDAVDVWRLVAHHSITVSTDVPVADSPSPQIDREYLFLPFRRPQQCR